MDNLPMKWVMTGDYGIEMEPGGYFGLAGWLAFGAVAEPGGGAVGSKYGVGMEPGG